MIRRGILASLGAALFLTLACSMFNAEAAEHDEAAMEGHEEMHGDMWEEVSLLIAVLHPTEGNEAHGWVSFADAEDGVQIEIHIEGLEPDSKHGLHIHQYGDCSAPDGTSAGGHYNPEGHDHGLPGQTDRHAGDLGNITADEGGVVHHGLVVDNITLAGLHNPIIGRGVILHAQPDTGAQPVGEAGARMACGVIGIAKSPE
jgi:Cu-Zn family superoxide dismutase